MMKRGLPVVLTVAGSDSGGGAGLQADLKTMTALGVFGTSAVTAVTAQNSVEVSGIFPMNPDFVGKQMDAVLSDMGADAAKTGMLYSGEIIDAVSSKFTEYSVKKVIVDPVMMSKTGARLLNESAVETLKSELLGIAYLVTPNIPEAEMLSGLSISRGDHVRKAAEKIFADTGCRVLIKGGHSTGKYVKDILYDGSRFREFVKLRIDTKNTHGTGDTYSSAIASFLALGNDLASSITMAREYLQGAIINSLIMGKGFGSLNHGWRNKNGK